VSSACYPSPVSDSFDEEPSGTSDLVEAAQPNPLLRRVDALCEARAWDELVELAVRCREAVERGKQLWPIAEHIDYRLALEAPGPYAAAVLTPTAGRFALGPLTEVAASTHSFDELVPYLSSPQTAGVVAAERVIRGENLQGRLEAHSEVLELPMSLQVWEPSYLVPVYRSDEIEVPSVELPALSREGKAVEANSIDDPELSRALLDLVTTWVDSSNGRADAAVTDGPAESAIGALSEREFLIGEIDSREALQLMAWAGASGGAHGRRKGAAMGRSGAWWAASDLCELAWPPDPNELTESLDRLRWYRWEPRRPVGGWNLHLAVEDPAQGWSAAVAAEDRSE
jgi:hypothetical protein